MAKKRRLSLENGLAGMTIVEHLEELRKRLFVVIIAVIIGAIIAFIFRDYLIQFLQAPLPDTANTLMHSKDGKRLVVLGLTQGFTVYLLLSLAAGLVLALPVVFYEIWAFVSPGLYEHERKNVLPFMAAGLLLFFGGLALAYVVLRFPVQWLVGVASENFSALVTADSYFKFVAIFMLVFGLIFELPLVLTLLARVGLVKRETLEKKRTYIHFGMWVVSAFATPGADIYSPLILGVAMSALFELSIIFIRAFVKNPPEVEEEEDEEEKTLQTV
jgi:sec-independent protein translocase protein TatC